MNPPVFPGLLVVTAPPEEAGMFTAGVCDIGNCLLPPPEGVGPARLIPGRDPGDPNGNPPSDPDEGCTDFTNADELEGNLVLVRSGGCLNLDKIDNALQVGALGVVLYHDETVGPLDDSTLATVDWPPNVLRPLVGLFISHYRGERLVAAHDTGQEIIAEMRLDPTVANEPQTAAPALRLSVAPNPTRADAVVRVEVPRPEQAHVTICDVLGRVVAVLHAGPLAAGAHAFRLGGLPSGVYVVRLVADEAATAVRLVVQR